MPRSRTPGGGREGAAGRGARLALTLGPPTGARSIEPFGVLPFDREAAEAYARSRLALERAGRPIGERDLLIASIALARGLTRDLPVSRKQGPAEARLAGLDAGRSHSGEAPAGEGAMSRSFGKYVR